MNEPHTERQDVVAGKNNANAFVLLAVSSAMSVDYNLKAHIVWQSGVILHQRHTQFETQLSTLNVD